MSSIKQTHKATMGGELFPVVSLLFAATLWGLLWYPLRLLEQQHLHGLWVTLLIYMGTGVVILPVLWKRHAELLQAPGLLLGVALTAGWCNAAFILALLDGNVVRVSLLFYLSPLWAGLLGWLVLGESLSQHSLLVLCVAFIGAVIMLWSEELGFPIPQGRADWLALSSGLAFAVTNVLIRKAQGVSVLMKTVVGWCGVIVIAGVWATILEVGIGQPAPGVVWGALLLGAVGVVIMNLLAVFGITHMPVHRSAVILLFELVVVAVSATLLADEKILSQEWYGGGLVIFAAYMSSRSQTQQRNNT